MNDELIRQLVVFSILMENGRGIIGKAPSYIWEKYHSATGMSDPEVLLDKSNTAKFEEWLKIWHRE